MAGSYFFKINDPESNFGIIAFNTVFVAVDDYYEKSIRCSY
jgi:hypothetical protein